MKIFIEKMINRLYKNDLYFLFGDGSFIRVDEIKYLTSKKNYLINCVVYVSDPVKSMENFPHGVTVLIEECWKLCGMEFDGVTLLSQIDVL